MFLLECSLADCDFAAAERRLPASRKDALSRLGGEERRRFLAAEWLLQYGLERCYGLPYEAVSFAYLPQGKPVLASHPQLHFNLSHSGDRAACALSDAPVGVDVQQIRPRSFSAIRRVCNADEWRWVEAQCDPVCAAFRLWTLKEAYAKWDGRGIAALREISFLPPDLRGDCATGFGESFFRADCWTAVFRCRTDPDLTRVDLP